MVIEETMSLQNEYAEEKNSVATESKKDAKGAGHERLLHVATETCDKELKLYGNNTFRSQQRMQSRLEHWGSTRQPRS